MSVDFVLVKKRLSIISYFPDPDCCGRTCITGIQARPSTTGSMTVERQAKKLKNNLYRKERSSLSDEKGNVLYSTAQNMRLLSKAKMEVKGAVYDVLSKRGYAAGRGTD